MQYKRVSAGFAACLIAALLFWLWVRAGRPRGIAQAVIEAESEIDA